MVLRGMLRVEHNDGVLDVRAGQAVITLPREWVRYSSPESEGAEYVAICLPAFSSAWRAPRPELTPGQCSRESTLRSCP